MFSFQKKLPYPLHINSKNIKMARYLISQCGGPNSELGAAIRYLSQTYTMPDSRGRALLIDIGTEELGHFEMIQTMVSQLLYQATPKELEEAGLGGSYVDHGLGIFPSDANGVPFSDANIGISGNFEADLLEDMAAEEKARVTYEHLIDLATSDDVRGPLLFLRQREVVHYELFKNLLESYKKEKQKKAE